MTVTTPSAHKLYMHMFKKIFQNINKILLKILKIPLFNCIDNFNLNYKNYIATNKKTNENTLEHINNNSEDNWDWNIISNKIGLTQDYIEKYIDKPWNWKTISYNSYKKINITLEFIENYIDKHWDWYYLSGNKNLTLDFIEKYIDKPWNWKYLSYYSRNTIITLDFIDIYSEKDWNWKLISKKSDLTQKYIEKYIDKDWDWKFLSKPYYGGKITIDFIDKYYYKEWFWFRLSSNQSLTLDFIEKYIDKPWNWTKLSCNKNITLKFIEKYIVKPWNWYNLYDYSMIDKIDLNPSDPRYKPQYDYIMRRYNHNIKKSAFKEFISKNINRIPWNYIKLING